MTDPPRTATLPKDTGILPLVIAPVAGLRELGTGVLFPLDLGANTFRLGTEPPPTPEQLRAAAQREAATDGGTPTPTEVVIQIARMYISARHCTLERRHHRIKVIDRSKNGTYVDDVPQPESMIAPGEVFRIGKTSLLALTARAIDATPALELRFGYTCHDLIDRLLMAGLRGESAAIVGSADSGLHEVAEILHSISKLQARPLVTPTAPAEIAQALNWMHGGVVLDVAQVPCLPKVAPRVAASLTKAAVDGVAPLYATGASPQKLWSQLGLRIGETRIFELRSMMRRRDAATALAALMMKHNPDVNLALLGNDNLARLDRHAWKHNLDDLRDAVPKLEALLLSDCIGRAAAERLGVAPSTIQYWINTVGLEFPKSTKPRTP